MDATTPRLDDILDRPATEIERPKPLPPGTYLCRVKGLPRYDKSARKGTPFIEFLLEPQAAEDDVNAEELSAILVNEGGKAKDLQDFVIRATYYTAWRLAKFLEDLGFDLNDGTPRQLAESAAGCEVFALMRHEPTKDGKGVYAKLADTARVE